MHNWVKIGNLYGLQDLFFFLNPDRVLKLLKSGLEVKKKHEEIFSSLYLMCVGMKWYDTSIIEILPNFKEILTEHLIKYPLTKRQFSLVSLIRYINIQKLLAFHDFAQAFLHASLLTLWDLLLFAAGKNNQCIGWIDSIGFTKHRQSIFPSHSIC